VVVAVTAAPTGHAAPEPATALEAPSPEQAIAAIWSDLLGVPAEHILLRDNFFDLGGQSLLAVAAASRIEARFSVAFDTRRLIYESLGQIAATLAASRAPTGEAPTGPVPTPPSNVRAAGDAVRPASWWQRWRSR
jgi:acyl carrier protein